MNSSVTIDLNGIIIQGRVDGLETFSVTKALKDIENTHGITQTFSSELTFYDDGYDILKAELIDDPNGFNKVVYVKIYDDCCGKEVFHGQINGDAIDWCTPDCTISANVVYVDEALSCVQRTLIDDDRFGFYGIDRPPIWYCVETRPDFIQTTLNFFAIIIEVILLVVQWVGSLVVAIVSAIAFLVTIGNSTPPGQAISNYFREMQKAKEALDVCGRQHPSPYLRDYIVNACRVCGLNFKSSILNDETDPIGRIYHYTVLWSANVRKGRLHASNNTKLIRENAPILNLAQLLNDYISKVFNADWRVIGNDLIFERRDYFQNINQWLDTEQLLLEGRIINDKICFSWSDRQKFAYGRFQYSMDTIEMIGNEALYQWSDIVEWNPNANPNQTGEYTLMVPFSPARFAGDALPDQMDPTIPVFSPNHFNNIMRMSQHYGFNYKLLIQNHPNAYPPGPGGNILNPYKSIKYYYDNTFTGGFADLPPVYQRFNYPFWFMEGYENNLYTLFHYINDPRLPSALRFDFLFEFQFECADLDTFDFGKYVRVNIANQWRNGLVTEILINYINRTIQVKGIA